MDKNSLLNKPPAEASEAEVSAEDACARAVMDNFFRIAPDLLCIADMDGRFVRLGKAWASTLGCGIADLEGRPFMEFVHPEDVAATKDAMTALSQGKEVRGFVNRYRHADGSWRWIEWNSAMEGDVIYAAARDITARRNSELALRENEELLRTVISNSPDVISLIGRDGRYKLSEGRGLADLGLTPGEVVGRPYTDFYGNYPEIIKAVEFALEGFPNVSVVNLEGQVFETLHTPLTNAGGEITGCLNIARNISERVRAEEERQKLNRLDALGMLAGGIAHDFNNTLMAIMSGVEFAATVMLESPVDAAEYLAQVKRACLESRTLTQQLLMFSKGGAPAIRTASLKNLLEEMPDFILRGSKSKCVLDVSPDLWQVEIDTGQIGQVLQNLLMNADQAMPDGGTIRITADNAVLESQSAVPLRTGRYVRVSVSDTGLGIPPSSLPKIFDPYFTTKHKGHGLGLAIVYSILSKHGGHITVQSVPTSGAKFTFFLPAAPCEVEHESAANECGEEWANGLKVLMMDDNRTILELTRKRLVIAGMKVHVCEDGRSAVDLYSEHLREGEPFAAVILDLTIPGGMGGCETMREILELNPAAKGIVASGYSSAPALSSCRDFGFSKAISKPFVFDDLLEVLKIMVTEKLTC